jgi:hypothetical protein
MKTSHVLFFLILFLILRSRATPPATAAPLATGDATLRRDMDEKYNLLLDRIEELEKSAYA